MREIKFLGKTKNGDGWYGSNCAEGTIIDGKIVDRFIPNTVRQFTGMVDTDSTEIWEGDIIQSNTLVGFIRWDNDYCGFRVVTFGSIYSLDDLGSPKVIGNLYDNPDIFMEKF